MSRIPYAAAVAFGLFIVGCHETRGSSADKLNTASAPSQGANASPSSAPRTDIAASHGSPPSSAANASAPPSKAQPKLKPVLSKPFPEGATDEQVCEAIANTGEKDLWVRFGHLVPLHVHASIFIIDAKPEHVKRIETFVMGYHNGVYWPSLKPCSAGKAMLYVRDLSEGSPDAPPGQIHLSQVISRELGLAVTESFAFRSNKERLSDYCRLDAELCEQLVRLDHANQGTGLCNRALVECRVLSTDSEYGVLMGKCSKLPRQQLACMEVIGDRQRRQQCETRIREILCPEE